MEVVDVEEPLVVQCERDGDGVPAADPAREARTAQQQPWRPRRRRVREWNAIALERHRRIASGAHLHPQQRHRARLRGRYKSFVLWKKSRKAFLWCMCGFYGASTNGMAGGVLSTAAAPLSVRRRPAAARLVPTSTGCSRGAEACRFGHATRAARCLLACWRLAKTPGSSPSLPAAAGMRAGTPGSATLRENKRAQKVVHTQL